MAPLFLFLTSALNVEMVYVILQGISQFALLNFVKDGLTRNQLKRFQEMEYYVKKGGDITVVLRQYEIKDAHKWSKTSGRDLIADPGRQMLLPNSSSEPQVNDTKVSITYHRLYEFAKLFEMNRLSMRIMETSLAPELNRQQVFNAGKGAGKSGSFFFFSHDKKYIIKTMTSEEVQVMLRILPGYVDHLRRSPNSLIAKIFGIFTIEKDGFGKVHVMLMENTLQFHDTNKIKCIFDLKGSRLSRSTKGEIKNTTIQKDIDFLKARRKSPKLFEMADFNKDLVSALRRDIYFLKSRGLLDYSLLFAIEENDKADIDREVKEEQARKDAFELNRQKLQRLNSQKQEEEDRLIEVQEIDMEDFQITIPESKRRTTIQAPSEVIKKKSTINFLD